MGETDAWYKKAWRYTKIAVLSPYYLFLILKGMYQVFKLRRKMNRGELSLNDLMEGDTQ